MRCLSCNRALSNREAVAKDAITGEYLDLCGGCRSGLGLKILENPLIDNEPVADNDDYIDGDYIRVEDDDVNSLLPRPVEND